MKMNVPQRSTSYFHTTLERPLNVLEIVEPLGAEHIDQQMRTGKADTFTLDEEVLVSVMRYARALLRIFLLGGA